MGFFESIGKRMFNKAEQESAGAAENKFDNWVKNKYKKDFDQLNDVAGKSDEGLHAAAARVGVENHEGMDNAKLRESFDAANKSVFEDHVSNPTFVDKIQYHKVPEKAIGLGVTASVARSLMNNGGKQTNSQLYNQDGQS